MNFVKFFHLAHTQVGSRIFDGREVLESQRVLWTLKMPCGSSSGAGRDYYRDSRTEASTTLPIPVRIFFLRNSANLFRSKNLFLFQVLYSGVLTFLPVRTIFHRTAQLRDRFLVIQSKKSIQSPFPTDFHTLIEGEKGLVQGRCRKKSYSYRAIPHCAL